MGGGLLCGGHGQDELGQTGAYRVYEDPAEKLSVKTASVSRELLAENQELTTLLCSNHSMFSRKIRVEYEEDSRLHPCPLKWLDGFSMRNFTNAPVFDDTIPVADGFMEIGARVPLEDLKSSMEDWFRRKSYLPRNAVLKVEEVRQ